MNSCRPSVDVLFASLGRGFGERTLAVVLTGMGQDGLSGCREIAAAGGSIVTQDEASSVVWGMPGAVHGAGLADCSLGLEGIADEIHRRVAVGRLASSLDRSSLDRSPLDRGPLDRRRALP